MSIALLVERPEWRDLAACRGLDPDLFYPEQGDNIGLAKARAVCAPCEVRSACLAYALDAVEQHGVWGGTSESERRKMRRKRGAASRTCSWCRALFTPTHASQLYCTPAHTAAAESARKGTTRRVG